MNSTIGVFLVLLCIGAAFSAPVYVSQYLPGNYEQGQQAAQVKNLDWNFPSYAGYITVNETYNSNTFFWYFPAQNGNKDAPLLLWLNGGPGFSSLFGLFNENGPFFVSTENFPNLVANNFSWNIEYSMVFMDNPVGVGFSYTENEKGYSTNEEEVSINLYSAISQFFQLFPDLLDNDFYVCGESYAGKYVPATTYRIHQMNQNPNNVQIPLKGLTIGDGMMDPQTQTQGIAAQAFMFSMFDENERSVGMAYEAIILNNIQKGNYLKAFEAFDMYINGDFWSYGTFYYNVTGLQSYFNFLDPVYPSNPYDAYLNLPTTQESINVRPTEYIHYNKVVESHLIDDWMRSVAPVMPTLLDNYKVMIYNGQNDVILGSPPAENFIRTINWSGRLDYLATKKIVWKINPTDTEPAGYIRQVNKFVQAVVRDAGHMVPTDQPARGLDLINRFINDIPFNQ